MNMKQRVALWDAINRFAVTSGVARELAVVEVERLIKAIEATAVSEAKQREAILEEQACPEGFLR